MDEWFSGTFSSIMIAITDWSAFSFWKFYVPCFLAVLYFYCKWSKGKKNEMSNFYLASNLPIIGHAHHLTGDFRECFRKGVKLLQKWKFPALGWVFNFRAIIIATPQDMKTVLHKASDRGQLVKFFRNTLGDGILLSTGKKWRTGRRIANTVMLPSKMDEYAVVINKYSDIFVKRIQSNANTNESFDIWPVVAAMNIDSIFENLANYQLNSLINLEYWYSETIEEILNLDAARYTQPLLYFEILNNIYLRVTRKCDKVKQVKDFVRNIIRERKNGNTDHPTKMDTYLDLLLETYQIDDKYTEDIIKDDFINMLGAGYVTTARLVSFSILMLAIHQGIQEKVYKEINKELGNTDKAIQPNDLNRLVYLEQCIKETLRKYPPLPVTARQYPKDIVLNDKQTIPASCNIIIAIFLLHWNKELYPNPDIWDPNRFTEEACDVRDKHAFLPFGIGPHMCPGSKYAIMSAKIQLVHLIRAYHFTTDMKLQDVILQMNIALQSKNGYIVKCHQRIAQQ